MPFFFFFKPHTTNDRKQLPMKCVCNSKIPARVIHTPDRLFVYYYIYHFIYNMCVSLICVCYFIINTKYKAEHIGHNLLHIHASPIYAQSCTFCGCHASYMNE